MTWVLAILIVWWLCLVIEPVVYVWRGTGQCRAQKVDTDVLEERGGRVYRCKFPNGHNGKHRSEEGLIW